MHVSVSSKWGVVVGGGGRGILYLTTVKKEKKFARFISDIPL